LQHPCPAQSQQAQPDPIVLEWWDLSKKKKKCEEMEAVEGR